MEDNHAINEQLNAVNYEEKYNKLAASAGKAQDADPKQVDSLVKWLKDRHITPNISTGERETLIGCIGDVAKMDIGLVQALSVVESAPFAAMPLTLNGFVVCLRTYASHFLMPVVESLESRYSSTSLIVLISAMLVLPMFATIQSSLTLMTAVPTPPSSVFPVTMYSPRSTTARRNSPCLPSADSSERIALTG